jgi:hypothetical protein
MEPDDEMIFHRVLDDSRRCLAVLDSGEGETPHPDAEFARASFQLHGDTLRTLARWYPRETRIRLSILEWEISKLKLDRDMAT